MQSVPPTRTFKDFIGFTDGVDSYLDQQYIKDTQVRWAENAVNKGGIWQTRPGYDSVLSLDYEAGTEFYTWWHDPAGNNQQVVYPQFFTIFETTSGDNQFIFGVSGAVFYCSIDSNGVIQPPRLITALRFSRNADQINTAATVKTSDIQSGVIVVTPPRNILIIQDGVSRAGYWDGTSGGHLNPTKRWETDSLGSTIYIDGYNQTRIGQYMAWSNNRLWVFSGKEGYASDLNDPLHFTEETVLVNVPSFTFPDDVTGAIDRGTSGVLENMLFVGTKGGIFTLWSGVTDRTQWRYTVDFKRKVFSGLSCVSHKSMIAHMGLLYWYSDSGIVSLDSLGTQTITQALPPIDSEMVFSKNKMASDRSRICAGKFDSYIWWSVPVAVNGPESNYPSMYNGRVYNGHTQVLDRIVTPVPFTYAQPSAYSVTAWQGVWTGLRPVEWATNEINGVMRTYCLSLDYDGVMRIWEGFNGNRADNGNPITWAIETKAHAVTDSPFSKSIFRHFRVLITQLYGNLSVDGYWKGLRGQYHQLMNTSVSATPGSILLNNPDYLPLTNNTVSTSFTKQVRDLISMDNRDPETCTSANVESKYQDDIDTAFSLYFSFSGVGALKAYRLATDINPDNTEGEVLAAETGQHILPEEGCPEFVAGNLPAYTLVKRPAKDALSPTVNTFTETGYQLPLSQ